MSGASLPPGRVVDALAVDGRIARVTLNRPELRNAFNEQSIAELALAFDELKFFSEKFEILGVYPADPFRNRAG